MYSLRGSAIGGFLTKGFDDLTGSGEKMLGNMAKQGGDTMNGVYAEGANGLTSIHDNFVKTGTKFHDASVNKVNQLTEMV